MPRMCRPDRGDLAGVRAGDEPVHELPPDHAAAAAVLALHHDTIPGSPNTTSPIDGVPLNTSAAPRKQAVNVAVSTVYSLGGQNAALVFKKV